MPGKRTRAKKRTSKVKGVRRERKYRYDWESVSHLLGIVPDSEVAAHLGCKRGVVTTHRHRNGIAIEYAIDYGRPIRDWESVSDLIGKIPDTVIAEVLECTPADVALRRYRYGIKKEYPFQVRRPKTASRFRFEWYWMRPLFRRIPDSKIAEIQGCSVSTARRYRLTFEKKGRRHSR